MSQNDHIKDDLEMLGINKDQELTIRYVTLKYKRLAKVVHPDRAGGDKCKFQEILNAYRRIIRYIEDNQNMEDEQVEDDFEKEFFMKHNILKECLTSYVVYIEEILVDKWKKVLENHLGIQKMDKCRVIFKSIDITITLYEKPKKDNKSKLHIQSGNQVKNLEFIIEKLSTFYREVCKMNEVIMTSFEFKNGQKSICDKCGKYFTNKKGVKQHMLRMHSSRKVLHKISRISVSGEEESVGISQLDSQEDTNVDSLEEYFEFQCGECQYRSKDKETLMKHVEAIHLLPKMLDMQKPSNYNDEIEELDIDQEVIVEPSREDTDSIITGLVEERSCPTPIPEEIYICGQCNQGFESNEEFEEHEKNIHGQVGLEEKVRWLEDELNREKSQHGIALEERNRLKHCVEELEQTKGNLEAQIEQLLNERASNDTEVNNELRKKIEEQEKTIKKSEEKHTLEVNELKRQQLLSSDKLRSAIQERDTLRENDRILLNTFDMMKKYMDQLQEDKNKVTETSTSNLKCDKCEYQTNSNKMLSDHIQELHVGPDVGLLEEIIYKCGKCRFETKSDAALTDHLKKKHWQFKCPDCSKVYDTHFDMREHKESVHAKIQCEICHFRAKSKEEMNQHVNALHNKMYKCSRCEFRGTSKRYLDEHFDEKHGKVEQQHMFACDECKYESVLESNLLEHQRNKHGWIHSKLKNKNNPQKSYDKNEKLCVFWNHGFCRNEFNCKFVHDEIPACYYQESCRKSKCPFYHYNKEQNTFLGRSLEKAATNNQ